MRIELENIGRRFNRDWIFKNINYSFNQGNSYAVLGENGSGKSTFLQIIAGSLSSSEGNITYQEKQHSISDDNIFKKISLTAPYMDLIEEFTLTELINFHFQFKSYISGFDKEGVIELLSFDKSKNKLIKHFSSGMKQRTKLALAFCSDTPILLLDEPASNLDSRGIDWYLQLIQSLSQNRLLIICSNQEYEYNFCNNKLHITDYKQPLSSLCIRTQ